MTPRHAYVTLVTNADYAMGATALARSLRLTHTTADIAVLHTGGVAASDLDPLQTLGCRLIPVEHLPCPTPSTSAMPEETSTHQPPSPRAANPPFTRRSTISASCGSGS
jgi:alpha-N-acetylglucosamine transferase